MNKINLIIGSVIVAVVLGLGMWAGWSLHKTLKPCPTITIDTITVTDPHWHHIADSLAGLPPKEKIKWLPQDTLYVPGDTILQAVDTSAILKDYFSVYKYQWFKVDDSLAVDLETTVTENKPIKYDLKYKILPPFTTVINNIDNSITYNKYLQGGFGIPFKDISYVNLELNYIFPKGYIGGFWVPELKSFGAKAGITIFKFKDKR